MPKHTAPEATWNSANQTWMQTNHRCGLPVPFSATWPTSGMTRSGKLLPLPPPGHHTDGSECSSSPDLLPTPSQALGTGGQTSRSGARKGEPLLGNIGDLLPTPVAMDSVGARNATSSRQPGSKHHAGTTLTDVFWQMAGITDAPDLLPTPGASDCTGGGAHPDKREGHSRQLIDYALLHGSSQWGKYQPAIDRWETLTRPAPSPTEPNTRGNPRLHAPFVEWMMGFPAGWICGLTNPVPRSTVPGRFSRNDTLRCLGNAVVPQQAMMALAELLERN